MNEYSERTMPLNKDRIAVIIGKSGETKQKIEEATGTHLIINSDTGDFSIEPANSQPSQEGSESLDSEAAQLRVFQTGFIIQAINYGFNPDKALKLLDQEYNLDIINLEDVLGPNDKRITRIKGRLIGEKGKIRASIEHFTSVYISIYNKYIALIGDFDSIKIAKKAITMLVQGAPHKIVLNFLQKEYSERKKAEFTSMWKPVL